MKEKKPNKYVEGFKGFCTFLYNPDDHTVFGRGGASWGNLEMCYFAIIMQTVTHINSNFIP